LKLAAKWRRFLAPLALLILFGLAWGFGLHRSLSLDALAAHRAALGAEVAAHPLAAALIYVLAYTLLVALSLPGGVVMTLAGGLLFGIIWGGTLAVIGASIGAALLFRPLRPWWRGGPRAFLPLCARAWRAMGSFIC